MVAFASHHAELREVARAVLAKTGQPPADSLGLEVPEAQDGAGATFAEVAVVLEELGRAAAIAPYLGPAVLAVGVLNLLEPSATRDALLAGVATGTRRVGVGLATGGPDQPLPYRIEDSLLSGEAAFVPDAPGSDVLLLLADAGGMPVACAVPASELVIADQPLLDASRRFGTVVANGVTVAGPSVLRFAGDPYAAAGRVFDRGALAVACDSQGLAEAMLAATVAYASVRHQFGRPIGSFQAVKHACADLLVSVTIGRELLDLAIDAATSGEDSAVAVSMAKARVCGDAVASVGKAMQLHGGIGYTWESGVHTYLKRAVLNRSLFGSPAAHRRRIARRYG